MAKIEIQLDPEILERARRLAGARGCTVEDLLKEQLGQLERPAFSTVAETGNGGEDPFWGLFGDAPCLVDDLLEETMKARQQRRLRNSDV